MHVAFTSATRGDELVLRATLQNTWIEPRHVTFLVVPARESGRGKIPKAEFPAELGAGEVGTIELTLPIPDDASGTFKLYCSLRVRGKGGGRWLRSRRPILPEHVPAWKTLLIAAMTLGRFFTWGGGLAFPAHIEKADRVRVAGPARGTYSRVRAPPASLEAVALERVTMSPATRRAALVVTLLAVPITLAVLWWGAHPYVFVVNAYTFPVTIVVGGVSQTIPATSVRELNLSLGTFDARAIDNRGNELDAVTIVARPPKGTIVWNIAGAAPVYAEEVVYGASSGEPRAKLFCGQSLVQFTINQTVDPFREPPREASAGTSRVHIDVRDMNHPKTACR